MYHPVYFNACLFPFSDRGQSSDGAGSETVLIPLDWFLRTEPQIYTVPLRWMFPDDFPFDKIMNGRNYQMGRVEEAQFFYEYDGTVVWGITARIIRSLVEIIREAAR